MSCRPDGPALVWLNERGVLKVRSLYSDEVIGREAGATIVIADPQLSERHFALSAGPSGWRLTDMTHNGTFANGRRLDGPHELRDGDRIEAGGTPFVFFAARDGGGTP